MVAAHPCHHSLDKALAKAGSNTFRRAVTLVDQQGKQLVDLRIAKAQFAFIGLTFPQVGGGRLVDNLGWHSQGA